MENYEFQVVDVKYVYIRAFNTLIDAINYARKNCIFGHVIKISYNEYGSVDSEEEVYSFDFLGKV